VVEDAAHLARTLSTKVQRALGRAVLFDEPLAPSSSDVDLAEHLRGNAAEREIERERYEIRPDSFRLVSSEQRSLALLS
jgi:hypothetical protein